MTLFLRFALVFMIGSSAHAWGRRGHSIVCETAALLLANDAAFMKRHTYDLGYYCNVPDLVWRAPATGDIEGPQHYMDMEIFDRAFAAGAPSSTTTTAAAAAARAGGTSVPSTANDPFALSRAEFEAAYPSIDVKAGRSFWRIRELDELLARTTSDLRAHMAAAPTATTAPSQAVKPNPTPALGDTKPAQLDWLTEAGTLGHYVGDLSMPLHLTEDYDGLKENQKGVHSYFEDVAVDELYSTGSLLADVRAGAIKRWKSYAKDRPVLAILEDLGRQSAKRKDELLKIDHANGRTDIKKAASAFAPMIREQLIEGALAVAAIWKHNAAGLQFNEDHFYAFASQPAYIYPPGTSATDSGPYAKAKPTPPATTTK